MGQKFVSGHGPDEIMLMPADPREWLPPGHLAWKVIELAAEMDLSGFGAGYRADGQGGRPYGPRMMVTLILYCYCRGRRSARDIEGATWDDVGARIIAGGLHPDHATIARFTGRHQDAVLRLLPESVRACAAEGLVDLGEDYINEMTASVPLRRLGTVDEIGYAALFLASDEAAYITGHTLDVNGGMHMS